MAFLPAALVPALIGGAASAAVGVGAGLLAGKPKQPAAAASAPTRDLAAEMARRGDLLRRRRGAAANEYAGRSDGVSPGAKVLLGPGG